MRSPSAAAMLTMVAAATIVRFPPVTHISASYPRFELMMTSCHGKALLCFVLYGKNPAVYGSFCPFGSIMRSLYSYLLLAWISCSKNGRGADPGFIWRRKCGHTEYMYACKYTCVFCKHYIHDQIESDFTWGFDLPCLIHILHFHFVITIAQYCLPTYSLTVWSAISAGQLIVPKLTSLTCKHGPVSHERPCPLKAQVC